MNSNNGRTLYDVLGVSSNATQSEIEVAVRRLTKRLEELASTDESARSELIFVQEAASNLLNWAKRAAYDQRIGSKDENAIPPTPAFSFREQEPSSAPVHVDYRSKVFEEPEGERYAGFWVRTVAMVIDILIMLPFDFIFGPLGLVTHWLYFAFMESSSRQATLGKQILGLYVGDSNGDRISFGLATGRYFSKFLSFFTLYIGFIMVAFTKRKQGLHDLICDTLVYSR